VSCHGWLSPTARKTTRFSLTDESWTRSSSPVSQEETGQQTKVEDDILDILQIDKLTIAAKDIFTFRIEIQDPLLKNWIIPVFLHQHFRLPTKLFQRQVSTSAALIRSRHGFVYSYLAHSAEIVSLVSDGRPILYFNDGKYGLDGLPESFSFDLSDPNFCLCANMVMRLAMNGLSKSTTSKQHAEGTYEMELYCWLYACFSAGCSNSLDQAWYYIHPDSR